MAKEKKRGLFSWLGLGQKAQATDEKSEPNVETQQTEIQESAVDAVPENTRAEIPEPETLTDEAVNATHRMVEIQPAPPAVGQHSDRQETGPQFEIVTEADMPVLDAQRQHETLPLPEDISPVSEPEAWRPEDEAADDNMPPVHQTPVVVVDEVAAIAPLDEATSAEPITQEQEKPTKEGFFARLKRSLVRTKANLGSGFIGLFRGKKIYDDLFDELEEQLLIADVGVETTRNIINNLTENASRKQLRDAEALYGLLKEEMGAILAKVDVPLTIEGKTPFVILMVGVNGVGKTTTIGKLARQFQQQGKSVMLAAGDTFRAAAVEQLQVWGQRNEIPVIAQHTGADSASVIFDAIQAAKARGADVLIADTAGRLQNKAHLMEELKKIARVMKKLDEDAPHEVMLTIDASTGQNAVSQVKLFHEAVGLSGITLTKLDGTAKGGVIFSVADQFDIPIRYIGVGERIEDLRPFNAGDFIEALFAREDEQ